jgi:hypothetical protein
VHSHHRVQSSEVIASSSALPCHSNLTNSFTTSLLLGRIFVVRSPRSLAFEFLLFCSRVSPFLLPILSGTPGIEDAVPDGVSSCRKRLSDHLLCFLLGRDWWSCSSVTKYMTSAREYGWLALVPTMHMQAAAITIVTIVMSAKDSI